MEEYNYEMEQPMNESFEMEQPMDSNIKGDEMVMEETVTVTEAKETTWVGFLAGLGIGTSVGALSTATVWFYERRKRKQLLKALQNKLYEIQTKQVTPNATKIEAGKNGKKEIDISNLDVSSKAKILTEIHNGIGNVRIGKKEREEWKKVIEDFGRVFNIAHETEEIENGTVVEELSKDNKNAKK